MPTQPDFQSYEDWYRQLLNLQAQQVALQWANQRGLMGLSARVEVPLTDPYGRLNYLHNLFPRYAMARGQDDTTPIRDLIRGARATTPSIKDMIRLEEGNRWLDLQEYRP